MAPRSPKKTSRPRDPVHELLLAITRGHVVDAGDDKFSVIQKVAKEWDSLRPAARLLSPSARRTLGLRAAHHLMAGLKDLPLHAKEREYALAFGLATLLERLGKPKQPTPTPGEREIQAKAISVPMPEAALLQRIKTDRAAGAAEAHAYLGRLLLIEKDAQDDQARDRIAECVGRAVVLLQEAFATWGEPGEREFVALVGAADIGMLHLHTVPEERRVERMTRKGVLAAFGPVQYAPNSEAWASRTTLGSLAATKLEQATWRERMDRSAGDLAGMAGFLQQELDRGVGFADVMGLWRSYLMAYFAHPWIGAEYPWLKAMTPLAENHIRGLDVDRGGRFLEDCDGLAYTSSAVIGQLRIHGKPVEVEFVMTLTHVALVARSPTGEQALINNLEVFVTKNAAEAGEVGRHIAFGKPSAFSYVQHYGQAIDPPFEEGWFLHDGKELVGRATVADVLAYNAIDAANENQDPNFVVNLRGFLRRWLPWRNRMGAR